MKRGARRGRNLRTGETLKIPATKAVRFKIGKRLRIPLLHRNPSAPARAGNSCGLRQLDARNDRILRRALVDVLLLARGA